MSRLILLSTRVANIVMFVAKRLILDISLAITALVVTL
jgi:hypothetical protein